MPDCVANAWKPPYLLSTAACCGRARNGLTVNLDLAQLNVTTRTVAAAWHQVCKPDLLDFAQVWIGHPNFIIRIRCGRSHVDCHNAIGIEFDPADVRQ